MKFTYVLSVVVMIAIVRGVPAAAGEDAGELDCLIEPQLVVTVAAPVEGVVDTVTVDRGDLVVEGQVLATLESSVEKVALEVARARSEMEARILNNQVRVKYGTRSLQRSQELFKEEYISLHDLDEVEGAKLSAEMSLREAREEKHLAELEFRSAAAALERRTIRSPITGVVIERFLTPGESATQNEPEVLKLAQIDPLRVEVFAPIAMLGKISIGMRAHVMPEPPVGGVHAARVTIVDRVVDAASATFGVRLELPNPDSRLPAGVKCTVRFLGELAGGGWIPPVDLGADLVDSPLQAAAGSGEGEIVR